ncbi:MAG: alkaline phosphatase family protein [Conexivisphaerales archaeon]
MVEYILGIDGASLQKVKEMTKEASLKNFEKILNEGQSCHLKSVIPYVTGPAWTSLFTGVNPGKHGIFDMYTEENGTRIVPSISQTNIPFLWEYATWAGKKSLVLGVPFYYPAPVINGVFVTGRFVPKLDCYPKWITEKYDVSGFDYSKKITNLGDNQELRKISVNNAMEMLDRRIKLFDSLVKAEKWDLVVNIDSMPDEIMHIAYNWRPRIIEMYSKLDELLGIIVRRSTSQDNIFVVSDHGFQGIVKKFYLLEWMRRYGYVKRESYFRAKLKRIRGFNRIVRKLKHTLNITHLAEEEGLIPNIKGAENRDTVRLARTTGDHAWVFINQTMANEDFVQKLRMALTSLIKIGYLQGVYDTRELYHGEKVAQLPNRIIVESAQGVLIDVKTLTYGKLEHMYPKPVGGHDRNGLLIIWGKGMKQIGKDDRSIYDILPTTLKIMKLPIPDFLDGFPIEIT